ncbi:MAG: hypothetical protein ACWA5P_11825 [bacterium]
MRKQITFLSLVLLISLPTFSFAQLLASANDNSRDILIERNPTEDYRTLNISSTATMPDYDSKEDKLKLTGVIYEADGVTPAKNAILFIEQADEHGDFHEKKLGKKRYLHHRVMVKTDENGRYTIYTFIPGNDRRFGQLQQLFPVVKAEGGVAYEIESFLFNQDPLLTKLCRKKINKKGDPTRILSPKKEGKILVVEKNIVLTNTSSSRI